MLGQIFVAALVSALMVGGQIPEDSNVLAVMMVGRHGDRTSKVMGNTQLTTLGKNQVYQAGTYFRGRYLNPLSPDWIQGADSDYLYNQIYTAAPYLLSLISHLFVSYESDDIV
jgi:acid phosphatase